MSFGFQVVKDDWQLIDVETTDGDTVQAELRILREVKLFEVSAVTFPAYTDTEASLRNVAAALAHRATRTRSRSAPSTAPNCWTC